MKVRWTKKKQGKDLKDQDLVDQERIQAPEKLWCGGQKGLGVHLKDDGEMYQEKMVGT